MSKIDGMRERMHVPWWDTSMPPLDAALSVAGVTSWTCDHAGCERVACVGESYCREHMFDDDEDGCEDYEGGLLLWCPLPLPPK